MTHGPSFFAHRQLVRQPIHRLIFLGARMEQRELPLLQRIEGPAVVPHEAIESCQTYREAVRMCWALRRAKGLRVCDLGRDFGFCRQHAGDYLNPDDKPTRRSLPPELVALFEEVCGNCFITQWMCHRAKLTALEELTASRRAA